MKHESDLTALAPLPSRTVIAACDNALERIEAWKLARLRDAQEERLRLLAEARKPGLFGRQKYKKLTDHQLWDKLISKWQGSFFSAGSNYFSLLSMGTGRRTETAEIHAIRSLAEKSSSEVLLSTKAITLLFQ